MLILSGLLFSFFNPVYNINQVSLRQAITPLRLQGRMNATMRFLVWGVTAFLWVLFSPVRSLRTIPEHEE